MILWTSYSWLSIIHYQHFQIYTFLSFLIFYAKLTFITYNYMLFIFLLIYPSLKGLLNYISFMRPQHLPGTFYSPTFYSLIHSLMNWNFLTLLVVTFDEWFNLRIKLLSVYLICMYKFTRWSTVHLDAFAWIRRFKIFLPQKSDIL